MLDNLQAVTRFQRVCRFPSLLHLRIKPEWFDRCYQMALAAYWLSALPPGSKVIKTRDNLYLVEVHRPMYGKGIARRFTQAAMTALKYSGIDTPIPQSDPLEFQGEYDGDEAPPVHRSQTQ